MTSNLFPFAEQSQRPGLIHVTLKGEALTTCFIHNVGVIGLQGIYILQPNSVNGKTWWFNKNGQSAIWYVPKGVSIRGNRWGIGHHAELGQAIGFIASPDDVTEPQEATTWKYFNGFIWKLSNPGDITVTYILNSKYGID